MRVSSSSVSKPLRASDSVALDLGALATSMTAPIVRIERFGGHCSIATLMAERDIRLTPTSYVVLGLIEAMGSATAYDLKTAARQGVGNLWALPHTQLYSESARLAEAGLLKEKREEGGRRRRVYSLTAAGRKQLESWRADTEVETAWELRDAGLLKLFFGADPKALAASQLAAHREHLAEYERLRAEIGEGLPAGMLLALDAGIGHEREYLRFWQAVADGDTP